MKFLIDAQLPRRLARLLDAAGHDALHTFDLPSANRTPDTQIETIALAEKRVVMTKDYDFVDSFWLRGQPEKLLLISTGNIANDDLCALIHQNLDVILKLLAQYRFIELGRIDLIVHC